LISTSYGLIYLEKYGRTVCKKTADGPRVWSTLSHAFVVHGCLLPEQIEEFTNRRPLEVNSIANTGLFSQAMERKKKSFSGRSLFFIPLAPNHHHGFG
jgi:hypothetical protein